MMLSEYIDKHYNGNKTHFADDNGYFRQNVQQMLKKGFYHVIMIEGSGYIVMANNQLIVDKLK